MYIYHIPQFISFILSGIVPLRYRSLLPGSPGQNGSTESFTYRLDTHRTRKIVKNKIYIYIYHPTSYIYIFLILHKTFTCFLLIELQKVSKKVRVFIAWVL